MSGNKDKPTFDSFGIPTKQENAAKQSVWKSGIVQKSYVPEWKSEWGVDQDLSSFSSDPKNPHKDTQPIDIEALRAQQQASREEAEAQRLAQKMAAIAARLAPRAPAAPKAPQQPLTPVVPKTAQEIAMEAFMKESGIGGIKESGISQRDQDRNTLLTKRLGFLKDGTLSADGANDIIGITILDIKDQAQECKTSADLVKFGLNIDRIVDKVIGKDAETVQFTNFKKQLNSTLNARESEIGGVKTQKEKPKSKLSSALKNVKGILKGAAKSVSKTAKKVFKKSSASISK